MALPVFVTTSCANAPKSSDKRTQEMHRRSYEREKKPRVIVQICLPHSSENLPRDVVMSSTSAFIAVAGGVDISGSTVSGQSVYENDADEVSAQRLIVVSPKGQQGDAYVFDMKEFPKATAANWSDWVSPNYVSAADPSVSYLNRMPIAKHPIDGDAPKLRYRAMLFSEFIKRIGQRRDNGPEINLPPC